MAMSILWKQSTGVGGDAIREVSPARVFGVMNEPLYRNRRFSRTFTGHAATFTILVLQITVYGAPIAVVGAGFRGLHAEIACDRTALRRLRTTLECFAATL